MACNDNYPADYGWQRDRRDILFDLFLCVIEDDFSSPFLQIWWANHKKHDVKKEQEQENKKTKQDMLTAIKAKLTKQELKLIMGD